jgi:hypothetical protein
MKATILAATRHPGFDAHGLITLELEVPLYLWTELLTHRRFARNASSARAMGTTRYVDMGFHEPAVFLRQGRGMQAATDPIPDQMSAVMIWRKAWLDSVQAARSLELLDVAKEQRNRLIPPYKMIRGIVTGTESAWNSFLKLRNSQDADSSMQRASRLIQHELFSINWRYDTMHFPYVITDQDARLFAEAHNCDIALARAIICIARCARVSYARETGKDDYALYSSLLRDGHLSPFEHIAEWSSAPNMNCFVCTRDDVLTATPQLFPRCEFAGWQSYRTFLESNVMLVDLQA